MDILERLVSVAHLFRRRHRHGDLGVPHGAHGRARESAAQKMLGRAARCARFPLPRRAVHPVCVLLHRLALPVACVAHGALPHELAREHRLHRVERRRAPRMRHHRRLPRFPRHRRPRELRVPPGDGNNAYGHALRLGARACLDEPARAALLSADLVVRRARDGRHDVRRADAVVRQRPRRAL